MMLAGVLLAAVIVAGVAIAVSSSHKKGTSASAATSSKSTAAVAAGKRVQTLLNGIPEPTDNTLGKASAPVSIIEYGDLECSICDEFALPKNIYASNGSPGSGVAEQIINNLVRTGKAKFVYRSLDTATGNGATPNEFTPQQVAAYAAGLQGKGWYYIELFYNEQGQEGSAYVNQSYLDGIAKQVPGLNFALWKKDLTLSSLNNQVKSEIASGTKAADALDGNQGASTPTLIASGPKGEAGISAGIPTYSEVLTALKSVQ